MPDIDLEALDGYLLSDASPEDSMMLSDLDGFLTGIVAGPEQIPPGDWMPAIFGGEEPEFASDLQMQTVLGSILGRCNEIAANLGSDPQSIDPIFYQGPDGTPMVADWAAGFLDAIKLRPKAWEPLFNHRRAKILLVPLFILGDAEDFFEHHPTAREKEFYATVPDVLQTCVFGIHDFWKDHRSARQYPNPRRQRGRRR